VIAEIKALKPVVIAPRRSLDFPRQLTQGDFITDSGPAQASMAERPVALPPVIEREIGRAG
jgi:hypothetical protein